MNRKVVASFMVVAAFLSCSSPCMAESKSKTVRVSCTIPEQVQVSLPQYAQGVDSLSIQANQGSVYQSTETWRVNGAERTKILTVTAL